MALAGLPPLDGRIHPISGVVIVAKLRREKRFDCGNFSSRLKSVRIFPASHFLESVQLFENRSLVNLALWHDVCLGYG